MLKIKNRVNEFVESVKDDICNDEIVACWIKMGLKRFILQILIAATLAFATWLTLCVVIALFG